MHKSFTTGADAAISVWLYTSDAFKSLENDPFPSARAIAKAQGFTGGAGQMVLVPGTDGGVAHVLGGIGDGKDALAVAALSGKLPEGVYKVAADGGLSAASIAAGWADGAYRFDRYLKDKSSPPQLAIPEGGVGEALSAEGDAIALLRDLVNTPAGDMTPAGIQDVVANLAEEFGAKLTAIVGDDLLEQNYPMVHAVGRAAAAAPRFLELEWVPAWRYPVVPQGADGGDR